MNNIAANKLGLGCVTFGREIDEQQSYHLMDFALANNITLFDTGAVYGGGLSEKIIGKYLKANPGTREKICLCTKIVPPYAPTQIIEGVQGCLERLQTAFVDVFYLHRWDEELRDYKAWLTLQNLKDQGKIKALGISNLSDDQLAFIIDLLNSREEKIALDYVQVNHNLAVSEVSPRFRDLCDANNIKVVTFSPLGAGFLTGKHQSGVQKNSRFDIVPGHQDVYFNPKSQSQLDKLLVVAAQTGHSPQFLAMAWAVHQHGIDAVLIGGRTTAHLALALAASKFYDKEIFAELE